MTYIAPPNAHQAVLCQLPDSNLAWLHFLDENGKEDIKTQVQLDPGSYDLVSFAGGVVTLEAHNK